MPRFPFDAPCRLITFPSGIRVACICVKSSDLACFELVIQQGENSETLPQQLQLSHLCEHLLDRLTSRRFRDYKKIEGILAQNSIYSNASVDEYQTTFILKGLESDTTQALEFLLESFVDPWIDEKLFEAESHSIVEELRGKMTAAESFVLGVNRHLFPERLSQGSSLKTKIENLQKLRCQDVIHWVEKLFDPRQAMLFLACAHPDEVLRSVVPILARLPLAPLVPKGLKGPSVPLNFAGPLGPLPRQGPSIIRIPWKNRIHDRMALAIPLSMITTSLKLIPIRAWSAILVDPTCMYSRLMRILRTEMKVVYSVRAETLLDPRQAHNSYWILDISCEPHFTEKVLEHTLKEIQRLQKHGITQQEYQCYQKSLLIKEQQTRDIQSPGRYLKNYKTSLLWQNRYRSNAEMHRLKMSCSLEDVNESCSNLLSLAWMTIFFGHASS